MTIAQGINKITVFKKQAGLGVPASGTGGQIMRREKSEFKLEKDVFQNNEIVQHQQSTGSTHGLRKVMGNLTGVMSPNTYSTLLSSLLRKAFTATAALTGLSLTLAGTAGAWTLTGTGFLAGGLKAGDVFRVTAATGFNANVLNKNFVIISVTATVITFFVLNGATITTGAGTACTITIPGKKSLAPLTGHTQEYWTVEDWYSDVAQSELFTDVVPNTADIGLPSTGNSTFAMGFVGLNKTPSPTQVLTTPTAATTTPVQTAVNGAIIVGGLVVGNLTGATIKIDGKAANMGAVIGSNVSPDIQRGRINVTGQVTAFYQDGVMSALFDSASLTSLVVVAACDTTDTSDFCSYVLSAIRFDGDAPDDGEKGIVRTYPFTAQINAAGGAALQNDQTIISLQDSQAA